MLGGRHTCLGRGTRLRRRVPVRHLRARYRSHFRYFAVSTASMRAFAGGVQNFQEITHERNLVDSKDAAENFVRTMQGLGDRLGPLLLQLPPDFTVEEMDVLD